MKFSAPFFSFLGLASAACHHNTHLYSRQSNPTSYSYYGPNGPLNWGSLSPDYAVCNSGTEQSPIALKTSSAKPGCERLRFHGPTNGSGTLENSKDTLQVTSPDVSLVVASANGALPGSPDPRKLTLAQFHFHTPSEHFIDGMNKPLEVHFVFQDEQSRLTVVGILIDYATKKTSPPSTFLENVFANVDQVTEDGMTAPTMELNYSEIAGLLQGPIMQYAGSLTTPPCSEGVSWNVASELLYVSQQTYAKVKNIMRYNARFIQGTQEEVDAGAAY
ncbi:Carbonic anhydrase [Ceratocystis fimbriata CBS 114723]|uniref:carbonic anhydrase n=1 Tax=Ceratocystis fimbriata CBS 114723 TaxID=1035309 RepID=A0A2C5WZI5_9PEZI|nr:Carbonic anhydrase [Ceratocystis fimbriata CBS 114723]